MNKEAFNPKQKELIDEGRFIIIEKDTTEVFKFYTKGRGVRDGAFEVIENPGNEPTIILFPRTPKFTAEVIKYFENDFHDFLELYNDPKGLGSIAYA